MMIDAETSHGPKVDGRSARKDANRKRVVDAAFRLFASGGDSALTMRRLAAEAGVSEATPYNLFQNKTGVLVAMFEAFLDKLPIPVDRSQQLDALQRFLLVVDHVAALWSEPSGLFCGLITAIERSGEMPSELIERPKRGIGAAMAHLQKEGWLSKEIPTHVIADRIAHSNVGVFRFWQDGKLTKEELAVELKLNALVPVLAAATSGKREQVALSLTKMAQET